MPLSLRFLLPLMLVVGLFAYAAVPLADTLMLRWFVRDLDARSSLIASAVSEPLSGLVLTGSTPRIEEFFQRLTQDERLYAVGLCVAGRATPIATPEFPSDIACSALRTHAGAAKAIIRGANGMLHLAVSPIEAGSTQPAQLAILHDMSFVERRSEETRRYLYAFFAVLAFLVALITVVVAQLSWRGWVNGLRAILRGEGIFRPAGGTVATPELRPIAGDVRELIRELEERYRPRDEGQLSWSAASVKAIVEREPGGGDVIVVSNREPYIHVRKPDGAIGVQHPASGLVTGARARHARVRWHLDRARQRHRRPRDRRQARPRRRAARRVRLPAAPRLAYARGGIGLLQRLRQRGSVAAVPHRARAAGVSFVRFCPIPRGQRQVRRRGRERGAHRRADRARAGLTTSRCCRA
jgi:trehalose 6-phosphate synthase